VKKQDSSQPPTVAIALIAGFFMVAGLIAMTAVVIPGVLLMVVGGFALLLTFVAQYFLWARWMFPIVQRWEREKENRLAEGVKPPK
jgi:VIT1/CCC1 family predicted Fe2+/Mn2+ transporter